MPKVRCCFCRELASCFFVTLNNSLWSTCDSHGAPFRGTSIELDPEKYDLEDYFSTSYEDEDSEEDEDSL